jgi:hypothetical protein
VIVRCGANLLSTLYDEDICNSRTIHSVPAVPPPIGNTPRIRTRLVGLWQHTLDAGRIGYKIHGGLDPMSLTRESLMKVQQPHYLANFDSATAMVRALANYLAGKDFPLLGTQPNLPPPCCPARQLLRLSGQRRSGGASPRAGRARSPAGADDASRGTVLVPAVRALVLSPALQSALAWPRRVWRLPQVRAAPHVLDVPVPVT